MTDSQFKFSFLAGLAIAVLGGVIASKAAVGFSLMALGAAIAALALFTRGAREKTPHAQAISAPASGLPDTPSNC